MLTVLLLLVSNTFMTFAWYGHLKYRTAPIAAAVVLSWLIAFGEYCFQVPANRMGYGQFTGYQLKIVQEAITVIVFVAFAYGYLGESLRWNYAVSFLCLIGAVVFTFWGRAQTPRSRIAFVSEAGLGSRRPHTHRCLAPAYRPRSRSLCTSASSWPEWRRRCLDRSCRRSPSAGP